ncbi:MAG: hypothetical protein ACTTKS_04895 [Bulleidia sp.]
MLKDYFSFDTIRDSDGNIVCYYITVIGTIEQDGVAKVRTDLKGDGTGKMAFGQITIHNRDRKLYSLLAENNARIRSHTKDVEDESVDVISYTASQWRAEEAFNFDEGDRVLIHGRAYFRKNTRYPSQKAELSITATGLFLLSHRRTVRHETLSQKMGILPQKD